MPEKKIDYRKLSEELDGILSDLQQDDIDIDKAMRQYERGLELVKELEAYLKDAENKVSKLKVQFKDGK